ncbi:mercuric transport protein MerTP [Chryseobacterium carnipullorum]|jgi:mercuric ion transport protein|uniref:Mercuric transport protein MerT n=3 Tax=Chryseobacterium group TaxID=2782232 RepID=A0A376E8Y8_CHRCU|nr:MULTISPECIES: mercuric transport protein MerTP [Chryseobacterium group]AZA51178.1 mercuric transport protein MerTP [Chryseobacterium carnipullorum]AZA66030.1 mercuric transport protein MerTP [Chryseobacterium carnipullorum]AZB08337.1 mercuric transport protein MerTP [Chryseobacterium sp. G0162]KFC22362.1 heavy metal transporter [Epilithonimonas lactis]MBW3523294.1 mercuric transport protein MerTP [Chryseobacterium sp. NKUCC03_KSP]
MKTEKKLIGAGLLTAIASSLCCITPILAIVAGSSGIASTFSWLEPFRPYFIGMTVLVLGFAWYQKLKPQKQIDCNCETNQKQNFMQTKSLLGSITVISVLLLSFPSYAHIFVPKTKITAIVTSTSKIQKVEFTIKGMTCSGCEHHVKTEISKLKGIVEVIVSYEKGNAIVKFDNKQTSIEQIEKAINSTGYKSLKSKIIS